MTSASGCEEHSIDAVRARCERGDSLQFLFFWGHETSRPDEVGKECLSQWYPSSFVVDGVRFPTAEHYMMYRKATLFSDEASAQQVLLASSPKDAKALGRAVRGFDAVVWDAHCRDIVVAGNLAKFSQSERLRTFLLATEDRVLVEASPVDRIWGIGLSVDHVDVGNPLRWRGRNLLGFALMDVRAQLR